MTLYSFSTNEGCDLKRLELVRDEEGTYREMELLRDAYLIQGYLCTRIRNDDTFITLKEKPE